MPASSSQSKNLAGADRRSLSFWAVWGGQLVSLLGSGAASIALSLEIYDRTGSGLLLSYAISARLFISIFLAPLIGSAIDRFARKQTVVVSDVLLGGLAFGLAAIAAVHGPVVLIIPMLMLIGLVDCALMLALSASVRQFHQESNLTRVAGLTAMLEAIPPLIAPGIGALLYALSSASVVFVIDGVSFLLAGMVAATVAWPPAPPAGRGHRSLRPFRGAAHGLRYIISRPGARNLQFAFSLFNTLNGLSTAMVLLFILRSADSSASGIGTYNTAVAVGTLLGTVVVARFATRLPRIGLISAAVVLAGLAGRLPLAISASLAVVAACGLARGIAIASSNVPLTAVWMEKVPAAEQGSVFGARRLLGQGPYPLALLAGGALSEALPADGYALLIAVMSIGLVEAAIGYLLLRSPAVADFTTPPIEANNPRLRAWAEPRRPHRLTKQPQSR